MAGDTAQHDPNRVTTLIGVSSTDFTSIATAAVDPLTHEVLTQGTIRNTLITKAFDYIGVAYPDTSTEVYTYKTGGAGGTTVGTITVVYQDAVSKAIILSVTKS